MAKPVELVRHKGREICYSDYSGLTDTDFVDAIRQNQAQIVAWTAQGKKNFRFLSNVTDAFATKEVTRAFKEIARDNLPVSYKSAAVGVVGIQQMLLASINLFSQMPTKPFDTLEEAMDWLAE